MYVCIVPNHAARGGRRVDSCTLCCRYYQFLKASGWWPNGSSALADGQSEQFFLKHWGNATDADETPPKKPLPESENQPVTWVSLNDARQYCQHFNKRYVRGPMDC